MEKLETLVKRLREDITRPELAEYCRKLQQCHTLSSKLDALQEIIETLRRSLPSSRRRWKYSRRIEKMLRKLRSLSRNQRDLVDGLVEPLEELARKGELSLEALHNILTPIMRQVEADTNDARRLVEAARRYVEQYKGAVQQGATVPEMAGIKSIERLRPRQIVEIPHEGPLRILAFSDYRVHSIEALLGFVERLEPKPDLIIYAGDDLDRFVPPPLECIQIPSIHTKREVEQVWVHCPGSDQAVLSRVHVIRIPRSMKADEKYVKNRFIEIAKLCDHVRELLRELEEYARNPEELSSLLRGRLRREWSSLRIEYLVSHKEPHIRIISEDTNLEILTIDIVRGRPILSGAPRFHVDLDTITSVVKVGEDEEYSYFVLFINTPPANIFEELAKHARYGLFAIAGNDDGGARLWIRGERVYEGDSTWLRIGRFLIVGQEGSTCGVGPLGRYSEAEVAFRLNEFALPSLREGEKMIIVSHTPPRGVLDRAMRFGERSIGSIALRDFVEAHSENVPLVICGHVHMCGGRAEKLGLTTVVNVSSHDDYFSRANLALITISPSGEIQVEFAHIPSPFEETLRTRKTYNERLEALRKLRLSEDEAKALLEAYARHRDRLFEDLAELATLKFRYGFAWRNVLRLYDLGVKSADHITEEIFRKAVAQVHGIYKVNLRKAWLKILREREKGKLYLINPPPRLKGLIVLFDTEYAVLRGKGVVGVLYGFYDLSTKEFAQFWFHEASELLDFIEKRMDALFIHYGGADRALLQQVAGLHIRTFNLLYFIQTSLVAPTRSTALEDIFDTLHGHIEDEWWENHFYTIDGIMKNALCVRILNNPHDEEAKQLLVNANKADIIALKTVLEKLLELPVHGT